MILAIDFDGVIHDNKNPIEGKRMGPPIVGAKEALQQMRETGEAIIIFCVWANDYGWKVIHDWMEFYQIPFDDITNVKPQADVYIDDKALKFESWEQIKKDLLL